MARIPEAEIERLKNEVSVKRLVEGSGIELKKSGKDWLGRCPFHEDDTASLVVTPAKNLWHCFGCGVVAVRLTGSSNCAACPSVTRWSCCAKGFLL